MGPGKASLSHFAIAAGKTRWHWLGVLNRVLGSKGKGEAGSEVQRVKLRYLLSCKKNRA